MKEEIVTYSTSQFYVAEGVYSIARLEAMVATFKAAEEAQDKAVTELMEKIK